MFNIIDNKIIILICLFVLLFSMNVDAKEINSLDDLEFWDYILIPCMFVSLIFMVHILMSDMMEEKKKLWAFTVIFLNIIGVTIYYFYEYRKSENKNLWITIIFVIVGVSGALLPFLLIYILKMI